jgi:hypothetical protein
LEVTMEFLEKHTPIALKKEICKQLLVMIWVKYLVLNDLFWFEDGLN